MSPLRFANGRSSEMAKLLDAFDWASHPFGPPENWSRALLSGINFLLDAAFPTAMWLGPELRLLYNDAYAPILGLRHPRALGMPAREIWGELWDVIGPQFDEVIATRRGMSINNQMLLMTRNGYQEETYWDYTFSPLTDDHGRVSGVLNEGHDVTDTAFRQRNDGLIIALDTQLMSSGSAATIVDSALRMIGTSLGVQRTGYGEVDRAAGVLDIQRLWIANTMPDIRGKHPLGSFGRISEELANGLTVAIEDNLLDPRTSDPDTVKRYAAIGLRAGIVVPILDRGNYVGGVFVQSAKPRRWTRYDIALAEAAAGKLWQALLRFRTETALRDSEERYRLIFEQANDIIFTADVDQRITACNLAGANALGLPPSEIIGRSISEFVSPEGFAQTTAMLQQKIERGGNTRHEISVIKPSGEIVRWENDSTLVLDRDGEPIGLLSISRDVTERRAFEQRRELLINELNHRVKNALALVQGIAHQTFRNGVDPEAAQRDFLLRIATLAKAHDLLTREQWEGVTLTELVRAATAAFDAARIAAGGPPLRLAPKAAVAIAMALHELSTNALKYGALSRAEGSVTLEWTVDADHFEMIWAERGGPAVQPPGSHGFGVKMLERALASDLHGTVSIAFAATGVQCAIRAPLEGNIL